jgi:hypothetical protein
LQKIARQKATFALTLSVREGIMEVSCSRRLLPCPKRLF